MKKPNFFIIGAPKCGTTSLARWLSKRPNVYIPAVKKLNFYNTDLGGFKLTRHGSHVQTLCVAFNKEYDVMKGMHRIGILGIDK